MCALVSLLLSVCVCLCMSVCRDCVLLVMLFTINYKSIWFVCLLSVTSVSMKTARRSIFAVSHLKNERKKQRNANQTKCQWNGNILNECLLLINVSLKWYQLFGGCVNVILFNRFVSFQSKFNFVEEIPVNFSVFQSLPNINYPYVFRMKERSCISIIEKSNSIFHVARVNECSCWLKYQFKFY